MRRIPIEHDRPGPVRDLGPVDLLLGCADRAVVRLDDPPDSSVLVVRTRRGIVVVQNRCPHLGLALEDATVRGSRLRCPHHGWRFDVGSGACVERRRPAHGTPGRLRTYRAWVENAHLFIVGQVVEGGTWE